MIYGFIAGLAIVVFIRLIDSVPTPDALYYTAMFAYVWGVFHAYLLVRKAFARGDQP